MKISNLFHLNVQAEAKILRGPHEDLESYLEAIDQLRSIVRFFSGNKNLRSSDGVLNHASNLLLKAMSKLEDEFQQLLANYRFVFGVIIMTYRCGLLWSPLLDMFPCDFSKAVEPDCLFDCLPNSLRPSPTSSGTKSDSSGRNDHQSKHLEAAIYKPLTLIPPRVVPLLHDLAQQIVQAGSPQELLRTYR